MRIQLSDHFTYSRLIRFTVPSIVMMIFTSIYSVVDGLFISNFVGKTPFAAINLIWPFLMCFGVVGFMLGTGGSALVSRSLGEGKHDRANQEFSLLIYAAIVLGLLVTALGIAVMRPVAILLGAEGELIDMCVLYGTIVMAAQVAFILQSMFQTLFITAEKPKLGLIVTIAAGVTNMVLDALFVAAFRWGLTGAALATALSQAVGGILPLIYFARRNNSLLRLTRTRWNGKALLKACTNGSSELLTNLSISLVNVLYNLQLLRMAGENGVAAYGVIMYANFVFISVFLGYSIGVAPVIGFHYGADHRPELKSLFRKSLVLMLFAGSGILALGQGLALPVARVFVGYDAVLLELTRHAFRLYAASYLLMGFNIFSSAFFTALSDGLVSAIISFMRTLVFQVAAILLLPQLLPGTDAIWLSVVAAELLGLIVTIYFFLRMRKKFHYA